MEIKKQHLFKLLFWGYTCAFLPIGVIASVLSLFGVIPINFNNQELYGGLGSIIALLYIPFVGVLMSGITWITLVIGLWIFEILKKIFRIRN